MSCAAEAPIVLVEDDQAVLSLLDTILQEHDLSNTILFDDSAKAMDFIDDSEVAAVVLDLSMPEVSGLELLRHLSSTKPGLPVVVVTGVKEVDTAVECMKMGAVDYITKPFGAQRFISSIRKALDRYRQQMKAAAAEAETQNAPASAEEVNPHPEKIPKRFLEAAQYIERNCSSHLYLEAIANEACLSKYYFTREFKKHFGVTPIRFMINRRIDRATALLMAGDMSISQIALSCGFSDQSELTKWFKRVTGLSPSSYRNNHGKR